MGLFSIFGKTDTVYFPGCITYFKYKEGFKLYKEIFSKLGIKFRILDQQRCSGLEPWEAGYDVETRKIARKNLDIFNKEEIKKIITNSPGCYKMFLQNYPKMLPDWDIEVINLWKLILQKLKDKHHLIRERKIETITYHDPCYLGRYCNIYEEPRKILELIGYKVKEMDNSREESFCCGSCGGLPRISPLLANKIAKERILQAKRIGVKKIIVSSFENYNLLKSNAKNSNVEILELSEVLADSLGIKKMETLEEPIEGEERILLETKSNARLRDEIKEEEYYKRG